MAAISRTQYPLVIYIIEKNGMRENYLTLVMYITA